jgi:hypothetical protein
MRPLLIRMEPNLGTKRYEHLRCYHTMPLEHVSILDFRVLNYSSI